jgi:hypothetical protein
VGQCCGRGHWHRFLELDVRHTSRFLWSPDLTVAAACAAIRTAARHAGMEAVPGEVAGRGSVGSMGEPERIPGVLAAGLFRPARDWLAETEPKRTEVAAIAALCVVVQQDNSYRYGQQSRQERKPYAHWQDSLRQCCTACSDFVVFRRCRPSAIRRTEKGLVLSLVTTSLDLRETHDLRKNHAVPG